MSFLGNVLSFEGFNGKKIGEALMKDPSRLITGVDPASTGLWNTVLGTKNHALVDQMGGATGQTYQQARAAGIDTTAGQDMQDLAHVIAGGYAIGDLAGVAGAGGAGAGIGAAGDGTGAIGTASGFGGVGTDAGATGFGSWGAGAGAADPAGLAALDSSAVSAEGAEPGLTSGYGPASSGVNYQQLLGKALGQMGQQKQQQGQGGARMLPVNTQPGNVPWNFMGGM